MVNFERLDVFLHGADAVAHLVGGLVGKRDSENLVCGDSFAQEIR